MPATNSQRNDGLQAARISLCLACSCLALGGCHTLGVKPAGPAPKSTDSAVAAMDVSASQANQLAHSQHASKTISGNSGIGVSAPTSTSAGAIPTAVYTSSPASAPAARRIADNSVVAVGYDEPVSTAGASTRSAEAEEATMSEVARVSYAGSNPGAVIGASADAVDFQYCGPQVPTQVVVPTSPCCPQDCGCMSCISAEPVAPPRRDAQEYIFDGGDQQPTVVIRQDGATAGMNPSDTVVYYETESGTLCVQPSNRVPIYAPRFGAVRQITGPFLAAKAIGTQRVLAPLAPGRLDDVNLPGAVMQPVAPLGEEQVNLIDAFQENVGGTPIASVVPPERMSDALIPFEGVDVLRTGRITDEEILVMGRILQNARTWFVPESLGVVVEGQQAHLMIDAKKPQDVHVFEIPDKCTLRICKTASHTIANSGDIVNFTIRFDNVGTKPVGNIVIMDSLSPRLEYIEGSQQSSVEARFSTEPNDVGSLVLRWEIDAIDKNDGGVVSFDCRVR